MAGTRWSTFAEALSECLRNAHIPPSELPAHTGLSRKGIEKLLKGEIKDPHADTRRDLAKALNLEGKEEYYDFMVVGSRKHWSPTQGAVRPPDLSSHLSYDYPPIVPPNQPPRPPVMKRATDKSVRRKRRMRLYLALIVIAMSGLAILLASVGIHIGADAPTYVSIVPYTTDETLCPGGSDLCRTAEGSIHGNVHMVCWQDAIWVNGQTQRWFYVQAPDGTEGFVRQMTVANQSHTPRCSSIAWLNAAAWAIEQDGQTIIPPYATNGNRATFWSSWSQLFAYNAWEIGAGHPLVYHGSTAQQTWELYRANGRWHSPSKMPPRGALVFFADGNTGLVGVSLGDGWIETTQGANESEQLPVTHKTMTQVGLTQLGYVPPNLV